MTIEARALDFGYPGHVVGRGLNVVLQEREVLCVLGPNGSGKTTLFRTLLGLLPRLGGEALVDGEDVARMPRVKVARAVAYVPQASSSYFDFSLVEMVLMGRTAHLGTFAAPRERDRAISHAALARMGIGALADRPLGAVSGGERQLALIARALATEATHLLMDEPAANLDFGNQALILEEIARLRKAGAAVLFSTHHPDHALRIADRVVMIRDGRVMAAGATADAVNSQNLSVLYGRPVEVALVASADGIPRRVCVPGGARQP
jgi:iron complex transport system ATP-binding protein